MSVVVVVVRCPEPGLSLSPARATTTTSCGKQKEVVRGDGDLVTSVHYRDMSPPRPALSHVTHCHNVFPVTRLVTKVIVTLTAPPRSRHMMAISLH